MSVGATPLLACAAVNASPHSLCWYSGGIAYAAHNSVLLYTPSRPSPSAQLRGAPSRVTCVHVTEPATVHAGCADGSVVRWDLPCASRCSVVGACRASVVCVDVSATVVASACASPAVRVWDSTRAATPGGASQELSCGALAECCALCEFAPSGPAVLVVGATDKVIHVFRRPAGGSGFVRTARLAGHQDWPRCLAVSPLDGSGCALLASGAQDGAVRLWSLSPGSASLDAVVCAHDAWVTGVAWCGARTLVTSSLDRTVSVWAQDAGIWLSTTRFWGVAGSVLSGNVLGFRDVAVAPDATAIAGQGYNGALHMWQLGSADAVHTVTGHFGPVRSVAWSRAPGCPPYLVTASDDKTVRVFAPSASRGWHELARPMVHGHSVVAVAPIAHSHAVVVASEEKIVRVIDAPSSFLLSLHAVAGTAPSEQEAADIASRHFGATLPPLSLSNRPIDAGAAAAAAPAAPPETPAAMPSEGYDEEGEDDEGMPGAEDESSSAQPRVLSSPPLEDHLVQNTLWPESSKLYGHAAELTCIATCASHSLAASGCAASRPSESGVCIWDPTESSSPKQVLEAHTAAPSALAFSNSGNRLASVAQDLSLAVWRRAQPSSKWELETRAELAFPGAPFMPPTAVSWGVVGGEDMLASAGGDNHIRLWREPWKAPVLLIEGACNFTSCSWAPLGTMPVAVLATGYQQGRIRLWSVAVDSGCAVRTEEIMYPEALCHTASVNSLDWTTTGDAEHSLLLASGGSDNVVRISRLAPEYAQK
eukprot:m51a1_g11065 putative elongator complex protein 2-like (763) ;mRNA; f:537366-539654